MCRDRTLLPNFRVDLFLKVSTFNPNVNIIATNRILFEFGPTGELKPVHDVFVLPTQSPWLLC